MLESYTWVITANQRKILAFFFITIFVIFGPLLVLYAKGWRINLNNSISELKFASNNNVAALNLKTEPRIVNFILKDNDGNIIEENTTPWKNLNLKPGIYSLFLEKEDYFPLVVNLQIRLHQGLQPEFLKLVN
jgi:hypothetical protein